MTGIELIKLLRDALISECPHCRYDLTRLTAWDTLEVRLELIEKALEEETDGKGN